MTNMQAATGFGRVAPATQMLMEDHLKKLLTMTSGDKWKPYANKNLPRVQHSPFGDFPADYMKKKKAGVTPVVSTDQAEVSIAAKGTAVLKKGDGSGGKCSSLSKAKPLPIPSKPKAGAVIPRQIPVSEFRTFYDRGDLPVTIEHGP